MSTDQLKAVATKKPLRTDSFPAMIDSLKKQVALALPKHLNADRMARIALTSFNSNKALRECDPVSIFASVITAAQLGLEPGVQGQCYLIPYGRTCQLVPGWKGLLDLANRSGRSSAWTGAVYPGDEFSYHYGTDPSITHMPRGEDFDERNLAYTYAVGRIRGAEYPVIEVWPIKKVWKHRDKHNKVGQKHYSFRNPEMYARKIPLLQVLKYLPTSVELSQALELEYSAQDGSQDIHLQEAIEGTFSYTPPEETGTPSDDYVPMFSKESAMQSLKDAKSKEDREKAYADIKSDFAASKRDFPPEIQDCYNNLTEADAEREAREAE